MVFLLKANCSLRFGSKGHSSMRAAFLSSCKSHPTLSISWPCLWQLCYDCSLASTIYEPGSRSSHVQDLRRFRQNPTDHRYFVCRHISTPSRRPCTSDRSLHVSCFCHIRVSHGLGCAHAFEHHTRCIFSGLGSPRPCKTQDGNGR